jgi:hypothetical protein
MLDDRALADIGLARGEIEATLGGTLRSIYAPRLRRGLLQFGGYLLTGR